MTSIESLDLATESFSFTIPRLRTARLVLREPRAADFERFAIEAAEPRARAYMGGAIDRREAWKRFLTTAGSWVVWGMGWWTVELPGTGFVGSVGIFRRESRPEIEIGWVIQRAHWGKGFACEAARAALEFAHQERGASRVIAHIAKGNDASISVAAKLGMRCAGEVDFYGDVDWQYVSDR